MDQIVEWRYKLRMLGLPLSDNGGPSYIFGDNKSVVDSCSILEHNLKKRHHALSYHRVREAIASNVVRYHHISGEENPADVLTKFLLHSKWWPLMKPLLHWFEMDDDGKLKEPPNCGRRQDKLPKEGQKSPKEGTRPIKQEE